MSLTAKCSCPLYFFQFKDIITTPRRVNIIFFPFFFFTHPLALIIYWLVLSTALFIPLISSGFASIHCHCGPFKCSSAMNMDNGVWILSTFGRYHSAVEGTWKLGRRWCFLQKYDHRKSSASFNYSFCMYKIWMKIPILPILTHLFVFSSNIYWVVPVCQSLFRATGYNLVRIYATHTHTHTDIYGTHTLVGWVVISAVKKSETGKWDRNVG